MSAWAASPANEAACVMPPATSDETMTATTNVPFTPFVSRHASDISSPTSKPHSPRSPDSKLPLAPAPFGASTTSALGVAYGFSTAPPLRSQLLLPGPRYAARARRLRSEDTREVLAG